MAYAFLTIIHILLCFSNNCCLIGCCVLLLLDRLLRLVMTLSVSTATTERSFSEMKIIKSKLRNKMGHGFLADSMSVYIEREISAH